MYIFVNQFLKTHLLYVSARDLLIYYIKIGRRSKKIFSSCHWKKKLKTVFRFERKFYLGILYRKMYQIFSSVSYVCASFRSASPVYIYRIVYISDSAILFSWRRWYSGKTAAMLRHLAFQDYLGHEFLVGMYRVFVCIARSSHSRAASDKYFTRVRDEGLVNGPLFFPANPACYLRSLKMPRNSQVAGKFTATSQRL